MWPRPPASGRPKVEDPPAVETLRPSAGAASQPAVRRARPLVLLLVGAGRRRLPLLELPRRDARLRSSGKELSARAEARAVCARRVAPGAPAAPTRPGARPEQRGGTP